MKKWKLYKKIDRLKAQRDEYKDVAIYNAKASEAWQEEAEEAHAKVQQLESEVRMLQQLNSIEVLTDE